MTKLTPLMKQYDNVKKRYPDIIVFFRLGDFYEMFYEDAKIAASLLNITLTARNNVPMCGVPYHSASSYLSRLMKQGYKVAICEQLEQASIGKKIVKRDVVRVITPGTVIEENYLNDKANNYLAGIFSEPDDMKLALLFVDVSTGEFKATVVQGTNIMSVLDIELSKYSPREIIVDECLKNKKFLKLLHEKTDSVSFISYNEANLNLDETLLKKINLSTNSLMKKACIALLGYLSENNKVVLGQLKPIEFYDNREFLLLNKNTLDHLEILENSYTRNVQGSLLHVLDKAVTPMGARLLRKWIIEPLLNVDGIKRRQNLVNFFFENSNLRTELITQLKKFNDLERLVNRISSRVNIPRDIVFLKKCLYIVPIIKSILQQHDYKEFDEKTKEDLKNLWQALQDFKNIRDVIEKAINDNPPNNLKDGNLIKQGFNNELDDLKLLRKNERTWLFAYQDDQRKQTNIQKLKVGFNNIFGYYIEVTKANRDLVPQNYVRVQTLVNAERFTTEALKEYEMRIIQAEEQIFNIEVNIYNDIRNLIKKEILGLQNLTSALSNFDVYTNFANIAANNNYVCPVVDNSYNLIIKEGRHPVVEQMLKDVSFVPNDTEFKPNDCHLCLITGPNMAGKSTYIRQVALLVIMAQIGSFVPANYAHVGIVDKIYTRIGAMDKLSRGESTFMVEMKETAEILNNATNKSLVILDEVGRGTSTFDGISLAWVIVEELVKGPKTLFATHYFELTDLETKFKEIKNFNMGVKQNQDDIIFLYKLFKGSGNKSYGIHVARIAGVPLSLLTRAETKLKELESNSLKTPNNDTVSNTYFFDDKAQILEEIKQLDLDKVAPLSALFKIKEWQKTISSKKELN